ncbi:YncE family protein [Alsobacter sp. KACC 23698]|uniref:YncE family protein n=1 Tax=Alsobacter sp. KACC 23698 TaxID=3149229 RepID=A0AAU7JJZ8_9HYPH
MRAAAGVSLALAAVLVGASPPAAAGALTVEARIPLGAVKGRIDHLALDLDGRRLFVAELGNDTVGVVDLRAGRLVQKIEGLAEPQGVGWDPDTRTLWVANARDGSVRVFDGATLKAVARIDLGDDADNVRISRGQVFVGYGSGAIAVIDPSSRKVIATMQLKAHPEGFQIEPSSGRAFVNLPELQEIAVLDLPGGNQAASWRIGRFRANFPMALAPNGGGIAVAARQSAALLRYGADGRIAWHAAACSDADDVFFDPRRQRIYISCGEGVVDVRADQDGGESERIRTAPGARTSLFSPDLDRLFVAAPARTSPAEIIVLKPQAD